MGGPADRGHRGRVRVALVNPHPDTAAGCIVHGPPTPDRHRSPDPHTRGGPNRCFYSSGSDCRGANQEAGGGFSDHSAFARTHAWDSYSRRCGRADIAGSSGRFTDRDADGGFSDRSGYASTHA